jgi:hypothetical protein
MKVVDFRFAKIVAKVVDYDGGTISLTDNFLKS